jgi:Ni,Fe-hydrogenase III large subunit
MSDPQPAALSLSDAIAAGSVVARHRPWPRAVVNDEGWRHAIRALAEGRWTLLGLWGDAAHVHMALTDDRDFGVLSVACRDRRFPSVGQSHAPAIRLERAMRDLWQLEPEGLADTRPWLDHGTWNVEQAPAAGTQRRYEFLEADGESVHQIAVGPVHAGIIEPGHFRFSANGEAVVRLEARLGYVHKGIERLIAGLPIDRAARIAGRVSGDSTVAYALAFAHAVEAAAGVRVPARAEWLRALMAELERLANHFGDIGAVCNDAAFGMMHAHCGHLREQVLRVADRCFGHRLMMDRVVPGGVLRDIPSDGATVIRALVTEIRGRFPELIELYDNTASLQDRTVGTGVLAPELARRFGCGGHVGRASGRRFDARRTPGYAPYDELAFDVPVRDEGDVDARVWIRIREVDQSCELIDQLLQRLPDGAVRGEWPTMTEPREGVALVEAFRGDVLVWLRIGADGAIDRCHLRDASWFQWPVLEAAIEGNIVADFPLCNKSFNCSYSGHDL